MLKDLQPGDIIAIVVLLVGWVAAFWKGYNSLITKLNAQGEIHNNLVPRVSANEAKIDAIKEELNQERLAVMTLMFNNEKAANERHTDLKVQIATLTERLNVKGMIAEVLHEIKNQ